MHLIGIAGPSGAGKTALALAVARRLGAVVISLDSYYCDLSHLAFEERAHTNFDIPDSLDHRLLSEHLRVLAAGGDVDVPVYDFSMHLRVARTVHIRAAEFGVVEGLWTLYWRNVRESLGTKVYVDACDETCFQRRLARDVRDRGRTPESVIERYTEMVRPMAERYILPARREADIVVSGVALLKESVECICAAALRPQDQLSSR